jgi:predicted metal-binding protein
MLPTKRHTLGHLLVCVGCCCGRTDKGKPEVPVDWLKAEWKQRRLLKHIQLSISGCLGPCDLVNVIAIASPDGIRYFGGLDTQAQFAQVVEWAAASAAAARLLPVPVWLAALEIDRFRTSDQPLPAACAS